MANDDKTAWSAWVGLPGGRRGQLSPEPPVPAPIEIIASVDDPAGSAAQKVRARADHEAVIGHLGAATVALDEARTGVAIAVDFHVNIGNVAELEKAGWTVFDLLGTAPPNGNP